MLNQLNRVLILTILLCHTHFILGALTDFCTQLTGIVQEQVNNAPELHEVHLSLLLYLYYYYMSKTGIGYVSTIPR